ncbi:MAG TPA: hypothetical protein DIC45_05670 [Comamonadaceae bacterium]|uniref:oxidoreductase-like domain-containing protein n=1 Tax=Pulveribacter sp. TaxID=2678893 RepID=UPI000EBB2FFC|nr:oxidoreductase-like domain-containing protein [Pulveribacter sp.]HCL85982.1 hypothetical protein [Comamonadaceae bacterium]
MLQATRQRFATLQDVAGRAGVSLRPLPPEPTTCCGRGCNGCVWEGFYAAAQWWCEDAQEVLEKSKKTHPADR